MDITKAKSLVTGGRLSRRDFMQFAVAAGIAVPTASALFSSAARAQPKKGGRFRIGLGHGATTDSLDPATYLDYYMGSVGWGALGNGLTEFDTKGNVQPDLAASFEPSDNGATWAFKLRNGVEFHNGKTVTATDVVASIRHHMGEGSTSPVKALLEQITELVADGDTVVFRLKAGNADFPYILSDYHLPIMPAVDRRRGGLGLGRAYRPVCAGAVFSGPATSMKRNPNYFRDTWFDEVEILSIVDPTARTNALATGDIDYMDRCELKTLHLLKRNQRYRDRPGQWVWPLYVSDECDSCAVRRSRRSQCPEVRHRPRGDRREDPLWIR
jgi:peptide/nickel transport system substrate-binding protein